MQEILSFHKNNGYWKWRLALLFSFIAILAVLQFVSIGPGGRIASVGTICPFRAITGLPCPLCGMTRSLLCFFQGHWHQAFLWHPLGPALGVSFIGVGAALLFNVAPGFLYKSRFNIIAGILLFLVFLAFWALRLQGMFPLPHA